MADSYSEVTSRNDLPALDTVQQAFLTLMIFGKPGECPVREILDHVGDKWSILVLFTLSDRSHRFLELQRRVLSISQRMLTKTLRYLERDGLVSRTVIPTRPPSTEYALTPLGRSLVESIAPLIQWIGTHSDAVVSKREIFDSAAK